MSNSNIITSTNTDRSDIWCPSPTDIEPYIQITLSNLTYITYIEIKSKILSDLDYRLEYTRENLIDQYTIWRPYRLSNNNQEKIFLDPPMIAKHVRLNLKQLKKNLCIQFELFGCIFTDGVVSYSMLQGSNQLEDDTYDGQYDEKQRYLYGTKNFSSKKKSFFYFYYRWSWTII
jgi:discoidin domain receptor family protein 2